MGRKFACAIITFRSVTEGISIYSLFVQYWSILQAMIDFG